MLLHSYLLFNYPTKIIKFVSFYCHCSYEIFGDIFSLAELEHNIIKYMMPKPDVNFIAQFYIPNSKFNYNIKINDYRILWSIYCFATTKIHEIPIYIIEKLNIQLDYMIMKNLMTDIVIKQSSSSYTIYLPIICQWYGKVLISSLTEIMKINLYKYYCSRYSSSSSSSSGGDTVVCGIGAKQYDIAAFMTLINGLAKNKHLLLVLWQHLRYEYIRFI